MRVRYYCHYGALTGYGRAARDYLAALAGAGVELEIVDFTRRGASPELRYRHLDSLVRTEDTVLAPFDVAVYHAQPRLLEALATRDANQGWSDAPHVALTTWETSRLPDHFAQGLARFDRVIVPSEFCADVICGTGSSWTIDGDAGVLADLQPITKIVPHCFDPRFWTVSEPRTPDDRVRFYSIGAWGERKNMLGILRAYLHEFTKADRVHLLLLIDGCDFDEVKSLIARSMIPPQELPALTIPDLREIGPLTDDQLRELHADADCFVSATRAEGWGLGLFEAAIMCRHVISPLWGGQSDFLDDYGLVDAVPYQLTPCFPGRGRPIEGGEVADGTPGMSCRQRWADPDLSSIALHMRGIYNMKRDTVAVPFIAPTDAGPERAELDKKFSYEVVGPMLATTLREMI